MPDTGKRAPTAPQSAQTDAQATEQKMRRALGLNTKGAPQTVQQRPEQARARHRFVQDGGVPVTVLNHRTDDSAALKERVAELQATLEAERAAHAGTRRQVSELQAANQALQTRLVHAELAHAEALQVERQARIAAQAAAALVPQPRRPGRPRLDGSVRAEPADGAMDSAAPDGDATEPDGDEPSRPKRGRPRSALPKEPKPVRWWTPSFRAAKAKP